MIETALAKHVHANNHGWNSWFSVRDTFQPELRTFIDDKLRLHSKGAVEFDVADNKYYIVLRPKRKLNNVSHIVFYKAKGGEYAMLAVNNGAPVSKGLMMLAFSEALSAK
jgi:hypothetical protein